MTSNLSRWLLCLALLLGAGALAPSGYAQGKLYRYLNDDGIKVISSSIPPQYVGRGYEILNPNGRVLQVVEPEPTLEDREAFERERALKAEYEELARRYSSVKDIEAARDRRLASLETNISILKGNISNLSNQIEEQMRRAAKFERDGQKVPAYIFNNIDGLRAEVRSAEMVLQERVEEHKEIFDKFADDVALFEKGQALQAQR